MEINPAAPVSPLPESSTPARPPAPVEESPDEEVVQDEELGENVDLMA